EDVIIRFGGHKYAAGLTVDIGRLDEFRSAFNKAVHSLMTEELRTREIRIDVELSLRELTPRFMRILKEFGPFGPSNLKPTFVARNLEVVGTPRIVGKNHLRFKVRQDGRLIDAIGFGLGEHLQRVSGKRNDLECVFTVDENSWVSSSGERVGNGQPQLKIKDLR
ncbi:MAG: single-stranded-DNA-specific exonuclease RecJ, partial [Bacteroidota bacterium]